MPHEEEGFLNLNNEKTSVNGKLNGLCLFCSYMSLQSK